MANTAIHHAPMLKALEAARLLCDELLPMLLGQDRLGVVHRLRRHMGAYDLGDRSYQLYHDMCGAIGEAHCLMLAAMIAREG